MEINDRLLVILFAPEIVKEDFKGAWEDDEEERS